MYPQYAHPALDPIHGMLPAGAMYHQPPLQYSYQTPASFQPAAAAAVAHPIQQYPCVVAPPPLEPLPSATDVPQTLGLPIHQLAEFASSMVYLMWHARRPSVMALHSESLSPTSSSEPGAEKEEQSTEDDDTTLSHSNQQQETQHRETAHIANGTSNAFKKFSRQILYATQLSESVVMLSLKYIAMLLQKNPNIQGAEGSEYRLFTVALMLANKFLDDNTFTNKTWADISCMKVTDLNIMELEFLDVLDFGLFVDKDEFGRWKMALVNFKNQLHSVYEAQELEQRQKMIEASLKSVGVSMLQDQQQQQQPWNMQQQADVQQQYPHPQYFYLLSKAQQPHFPTQRINQPLMRVPLRVPAHPVYMNAGHSSSHLQHGTQAPLPLPPPPPPPPPPPSQFQHHPHHHHPHQPIYDNMMRSSSSAVMSTGHPPPPFSATTDNKRSFAAPSPVDTQQYASHPSYPLRPSSQVQQGHPMNHDTNVASYTSMGEFNEGAAYSYRTASPGGFVNPVVGIGEQPQPMYYYMQTPATGSASNTYGRSTTTTTRSHHVENSYPSSSTTTTTTTSSAGNGSSTTNNNAVMHNQIPLHNRTQGLPIHHPHPPSSTSSSSTAAKRNSRSSSSNGPVLQVSASH